MESDDKAPNPEHAPIQSESDKPLATLADAEARIDPPAVDQTAAAFEAHPEDDEREERFEQAKAMLEGPGGDIGTEIDVDGMDRVDRLPILPLGIDALGRLWAIDHHEGKLRLVGRASK